MERPFRDVKERFLEECAATGPAPEPIDELNARAATWIEERIHSRVHRGMGEIPADRFAIEAPMLLPLPRRRFDTAYVEARRVHVAIPQIEWRGVHYSVPPPCLGQKVEVRHEVDSSTIEVRWAGEVVGTHTVADPATGEVWDAAHWRPPSRRPSVAAGDVICRSSFLTSSHTRCHCAWTSKAMWTWRSRTCPVMEPRPGRDQLPL